MENSISSRPSIPARIGPALAAAGLLGTFGILADAVSEGDTMPFDHAVLMLFRNPSNVADPIGPPWLEEAVRDITSLGSFSLLGLITALVAAELFISRMRATAWYLLGAVIGGAVISTVLKALFDRPRPDLASAARVFTASFPSGHATVSAVVFLTIGALLAGAADRPLVRAFYLAVAIFLTVIVGVSRIYLGVHYPTDVLAGWLIGSAWALLCWAGAQLFLPKRSAGVTD